MPGPHDSDSVSRMTRDAGPENRIRLAELLVGLTLAVDMGMGWEPGEAARASVIATRLASDLGVDDPAAAYFTTLLQHVGCTAYAHEAAALLGGDEIAVKSAAMRTDFTRPHEVLLVYLPSLAPQAGLLTRLRAAGTAAVRARRIVAGYTQANCDAAALTARRIALPEPVCQALRAVYEQSDGGGGPRGLRGDEIPVAARIAQVAVHASLFDRLGGAELATTTVRRRAGAALDDEIAAAFCRCAPELLAELAAADVLVAAVEAEPEPPVEVGADAAEGVCRAFGEVIDLKSPYHHGHATGVAELAVASAEWLRLPASDADELRLAGLAHDLGRAAVPNGIWEKSGPLTSPEWERVRLHPYHTERILAASPPLSTVARLASMHHERLDGSGYHREVRAASIPMPARILAAADAFQAMTQARAYRAALPPEEASARLSAEAAGGRLDGDAVAAVLAAAGRGGRRRRAGPAGLTPRQVEVLRLLAQGLSNREIGRRLVVSPRTAERHVQDIYARIGVASRAGAALFAMEHDLLP